MRDLHAPLRNRDMFKRPGSKLVFVSFVNYISKFGVYFSYLKIDRVQPYGFLFSDVFLKSRM